MQANGFFSSYIGKIYTCHLGDVIDDELNFLWESWDKNWTYQ